MRSNFQCFRQINFRCSITSTHISTKYIRIRTFIKLKLAKPNFLGYCRLPKQLHPMCNGLACSVHLIRNKIFIKRIELVSLNTYNASCGDVESILLVAPLNVTREKKKWTSMVGDDERRAIEIEREEVEREREREDSNTKETNSQTLLIMHSYITWRKCK